MIQSLSSNSAKLGGARRVNYAVVNAKLRHTRGVSHFIKMNPTFL